jgi:hypothetical protein
VTPSIYFGLLSAGGVTNVWLAAAPTTDPIGIFVPYLNLGVIVSLVIMAVTKRGFIPKWVLDDQERVHASGLVELKTSHERELAQIRRELEAAVTREEEYKRLNQDLQTYQREQLQPALIESTRIVSAYVQALARRGGDV